ncbi:hypothetical protein, partial [Escherichia coli]
MAGLIRTHGPCRLADREFRPFQTLANSIISQQLSAKAADTIERRVQAIVPGWHCCKVSDEAAFCLIQRPYISKTLLT